MYSVIGLLAKRDDVTVDAFRSWWMRDHVQRVLRLPGLLDYRIYPIDEELDQQDLSFSDPAWHGVAIITFASKQAFLDAFAAPEGHDDQGSFNEGAPASLVLCGQPIVHMSEGIRLT